CSAARTCCSSTSRPTIWTSTRCGRWRKRFSTSPAAPSSSATTDGSSIGLQPTCSPSRATARSCGSRATTRITKPTGIVVSAPTRTRRIGSSTAGSRDDRKTKEGCMNGDQAKFLVEYYAKMIESEVPTTARVIGAVPEDQKDYKPDEKSRS